MKIGGLPKSCRPLDVKWIFKNRWRYRLSDLWYTFFHPAVLWLEGAEDTYFHGEYSFSGVSDPWGVSWDPFFILPLKSLILHQVGVFACWRRVFCWKCLKPSPGSLQDPLSLPIEEKKFFVEKWPQNHRDFAKILSSSDFARARGKVVLSRAQKLKNNICSWVLGDWDLV